MNLQQEIERLRREKGLTGISLLFFEPFKEFPVQTVCALYTGRRGSVGRGRTTDEAVQQAVKELERQVQEEVEAIKAYKRRIRNPLKRQYADVYLSYLLGMLETEPPLNGLSPRAAQDVRIRLGKLYLPRGEPKKL